MKKARHGKYNSKSNLNFLLTILLIVGIALFIFSFFNICKWLIDSNKTKNIIKEITKSVTVEDEDKNIDVDLSKLKQINQDTVGWIQVAGTQVNYPFTKTTDNDFYLTHSFDKSSNAAGWIFLDYRNNIDSPDKNNILYAHGRLDNTMFGSLKNVLNNDWYNNSSNHIIKLLTEKQNSEWKIFSVYHIPVTDDYIKIDFSSDDEFLEFINMLKKRSTYDFNVDITYLDNIITLSTCYNNNSSERLVIHAKLVK